VWTRGGAYDPKIQTQPRFLNNAPTNKFHHPMFTHCEVIMLINKHTNKEMLLKISTSLHYGKLMAFIETTE